MTFVGTYDHPTTDELNSTTQSAEVMSLADFKQIVSANGLTSFEGAGSELSHAKCSKNKFGKLHNCQWKSLCPPKLETVQWFPTFTNWYSINGLKFQGQKERALNALGFLQSYCGHGKAEVAISQVEVDNN